MASRQFVIFTLNNEDFGVEIVQVKEIIKPMEIFKLPNTPEYIEGLINLRGQVHTVFNLRKKFSLPLVESDENTKIIIVSVNDMPVGFIVDEVKEIIRIEDESIEITPKVTASLNKIYLSGVAKIDDKIVFLLDLDAVLTLNPEEKVFVNSASK